MRKYETGTMVRVPQCRHCETRNAKGLRYVYDEYQLEFKCDVCGKVMVQGELESSVEEALDSMYGKEQAEINRDRYHQERMEEMNRHYKYSLENFKALPDPVGTFYNMREPNFDEWKWILDRKAEKNYKEMYA